MAQYVALFRVCFPGASHFNDAFLRWLYVENPHGQVFGTDAVVDGVVVAHYACVPALVRVRGRANVRALLSLNTATHPDHQGKGLFTRLASDTYERAAADGFEVVFGVANQNSIGGFSRKLGFQDVRGLDARVGLGRFPKLDWSKARERAQFERLWNLETLAWRQRNPSNPLSVADMRDGICTIAGKTGHSFITVRAAVPLQAADSVAVHDATGAPALHLTLGLEPEGTASYGLSCAIPERFKPSPLRLIYRDLKEPSARIEANAVIFTFIDFDAY